MNLREVALCFVFQNDACCTMGLVADNQIHLTAILIDGLFHHIDTLISGEDDGTTPILIILLELAQNTVCVGGGRHGEINHAGILIISIHHLPAGLGIRTDADGSQIVLFVGHPCIERLA